MAEFYTMNTISPGPVVGAAGFRRAVRRAWSDLYNQPGALAVTFDLFKRRCPTPTPQEIAKRVFGAMDNGLSGPRWSKMPTPLRTQGFLAPEDWGSHPHLHGVVILPQSHLRLPDNEQAFVESVLIKLYPEASIDIQCLNTPEKWLDYATKIHGIDSLEVSHAMDFWNNRWS